VTPRVLAIVLAVYVGLDLANPLMPGAVRFVEGELQTVEGGRQRGDTVPAAAVVAAVHERLVADPPRDVARSVPTARRPSWQPPPRRPARIQSTPPSASDDH
jgi:hypothetical protein